MRKWSTWSMSLERLGETDAVQHLHAGSLAVRSKGCPPSPWQREGGGGDCRQWALEHPAARGQGLGRRRRRRRRPSVATVLKRAAAPPLLLTHRELCHHLGQGKQDTYGCTHTHTPPTPHIRPHTHVPKAVGLALSFSIFCTGED